MKPYLVHQCFDQSKVMSFLEPYRYQPITLEDFVDIADEAAILLGEVRPATCRCSYRVSEEDAKQLVDKGVASYLIEEWRYNEVRKEFFPAPSSNLVWGGIQTGKDSASVVRTAYAAKTPRVMTIEKANMERAYLDGNKEEAQRIEDYGALSRKVITDLTVETSREDPFEGRAVLVMIDLDQRTKGIDSNEKV